MNRLKWTHNTLNIVDLLRTAPSKVSFSKRVRRLELSPGLAEKVMTLQSLAAVSSGASGSPPFLSRTEEKELATEVLLYRHRFTTQMFEHQLFRQAALTVIQNIYLFRQRRIFFGSSAESSEQERQEALVLFSQNPDEGSVPLAKTFQHLILARVWDRIVSLAAPALLREPAFIALHETVERLNTLRNIYMVLSSGLVRKLVQNINAIYRQSITSEDALQIGSFGIARAAYRYHPSCGVRFSTYAANWVLKEIQRQALEGRLIRISSNVVEHFARAAKEGNAENLTQAEKLISDATAWQTSLEGPAIDQSAGTLTRFSPVASYETRQLRSSLLEAVERLLSAKSADVIKRRYGLPPYDGREQSVIDIGKAYGVTRGSIYQLEQAALTKLRKHFTALKC